MCEKHFLVHRKKTERSDFSYIIMWPERRQKQRKRHEESRVVCLGPDSLLDLTKGVFDTFWRYILLYLIPMRRCCLNDCLTISETLREIYLCVWNLSFHEGSSLWFPVISSRVNWSHLCRVSFSLTHNNRACNRSCNAAAVAINDEESRIISCYLKHKKRDRKAKHVEKYRRFFLVAARSTAHAK